MKKPLTLIAIVLCFIQLNAQENAILDSIQAKGTAIVSFESKIKKSLKKSETVEILEGLCHYVATDKMSAFFEGDNYMIINGNRMKVDIGIFHGKFKLSRNKTMRSVSHIFLYAIQGRCKELAEGNNYSMKIDKNDDDYIVQFTSKKKHLLGIGYRIVTFHYDCKDLNIKKIILIDHNSNVDTFTLSEAKYNIKVDASKFEL